MDNLLRLIHHHRPVIDYNVLPLTGKQLLQIDGRDYAGLYKKHPLDYSRQLPFRQLLDQIKMSVHRLMLDPALPLLEPRLPKCSSSSIYKYIQGKPSTCTNLHQEKGIPSEFSLDPIEFRRTFKSIAPTIIEALHGGEVLRKAREVLRKGAEAATDGPTSQEGEADTATARSPKQLPHFEIDIHADGAQVYDNSEQASITAILDILDDFYLEHMMRMPYAMQLLGGFNKNPVPPADIEKAKVVLVNFITEHKRLGYLVRFVNHEILHLPEDAALAEFCRVGSRVEPVCFTRVKCDTGETHWCYTSCSRDRAGLTPV
ncbi:hypothetical protein OUZ56_005363 [Daphnia magna]|uniref:Uncharacterized protein n=1 Tax=Daphnia magna TaxID=35525 RepID=A0ABQ9YSL3_9CRUS|nr:hypothetical protein OUZ56_005363 [Daphnia magna]